MRLHAGLIGAMLFAMPGLASAQSYQCAVPSSLPRPHPDGATAEQPQRVRPISGYTLALTWTPEYCYGAKHEASAAFECRSGNRFGFTLHGLWPDGVGKEWPQYCTTAALLPQTLIAQHVCATPSPQLLQHEWAKHGTCTSMTPDAYFAKSTGLYAKLHYPDMNQVSHGPLNAGQFAAAFAAANPGLPVSAIRVTVKKGGWLDELWLCLDKRFAYTRCAAGSGGVSDDTTLKISHWRDRGGQD
jgi:ribonuclease T2